jgi:hypothetical protein
MYVCRLAQLGLREFCTLECLCVCWLALLGLREFSKIEYPGDKSTRTAGLTTAKILINSVISTFGAKFLVIDIKKIYLNIPLCRFEYLVINLSLLPQETIDKYDLIELA